VSKKVRRQQKGRRKTRRDRGKIFEGKRVRRQLQLGYENCEEMEPWAFVPVLDALTRRLGELLVCCYKPPCLGKGEEK